MKRIAMLIGVVAVLLSAACSSKNIEIHQEEKYKVVRPLVQDAVSTKEYVTELNAVRNVEIRTRVGGFIEAIQVDEGQAVQKGQVLFTINNRQFQQDLQKAKAATKRISAELQSAEIELKGAKNLLDKNYISEPEYHLAAAKVAALTANLEEARLDEEQAELQLSFTEVKAPFSGIINRLPIKAGSLVDEGTLLTTISNNREMFAYFNVSEVDYLEYALSRDENETKEVSLILANGTLYPQKGFIETTESEFDNNTGTLAFRARFPNPDKVLKHGATGKIKVNTTINNALLIPQKSTFDRQEQLCVFVVEEDNSLQVRKITPLLRLPYCFAVDSGLSAHDRILYEGIQLVKEGDKIVPEAVSFSQILNQ